MLFVHSNPISSFFKEVIMRRLFPALSFLVGLALVFASFYPVSANGLKNISAKALDDHECDSTEWHFVITQIDNEDHAPGSINVFWANGASESVPLWKFTGGTAHYVTTSNLDSVVTSATAQIYEEWSGQFNLSHGPCGSTPTATVTEVIPTSTPTEVIVTLTATPTEDIPTSTPTEVIVTFTPTPTGTVVTVTPVGSQTPTATVTVSPTSTPTVEITETPGVTVTPTATPVTEDTPTPTITVVITATPTGEITITATPTEPSTEVKFWCAYADYEIVGDILRVTGSANRKTESLKEVTVQQDHVVLASGQTRSTGEFTIDLTQPWPSGLIEVYVAGRTSDDCQFSLNGPKTTSTPKPPKTGFMEATDLPSTLPFAGLRLPGFGLMVLSMVAFAFLRRK